MTENGELPDDETAGGVYSPGSVLFVTSLLENLPHGVALLQLAPIADGLDPDGQFLEVNPAFEQITGLDRSVLLSSMVRQVISNFDASWVSLAKDASRTGGRGRVDRELVIFGKTYRVAAFSPQAGQLVFLFLGELEIEKAALQMAQQLKESQTLYQISQTLAGTLDLTATLQQIANAAYSLTQAANQAVVHLLESNEEFLQAVAVANSLPETAHNRPILRMNFRPGQGIAGLALSEGKTIRVADITTDARFIPIPQTAGGRDDSGRPPIETGPFFLSLLVAPIVTEGKRLGTLSIQGREPDAFTDEDERLASILGVQAAVAIEKAKLYSSLEQALEHEKAVRAQLVQSEKLAALGKIVASVAHEMNNPLQAIQNALYLINLEETLSPQAREDLQTVLNETARMGDLITRLRETYRPTLREEFKAGSLNTLVVEVQKLLATHLTRQRVGFEFIPDKNLPIISMIRDQIKQVILNVCLNAVEAMEQGGELCVRTHADDPNHGVIITISDNGPSINPKILPNIFDPFVTTKEGGTGLGLAITYDIIQRHHGQIDVESNMGMGTEFTIWLPVEQKYGVGKLAGE